MNAVPVELHTLVWNPDAAPSALVLHGLGSDAGTTWRLAGALADRGLRVVAPDLRGHGASPPATGYHLDGYAADLRRLGRGWTVAVGHSLGGALCAVLAAEEGFADRVVLIDPVLRLGAAAAEELRAALVAESGGRLDHAGLRAAQPRWDDEDVHRKVVASSRFSPRVADATLDDNLPWDLRWLPERWRCPVHVLAADPAQGALLGPEDVAGLVRRPHVTVTTVAGAGHSIHRDDPAAVLAAVLAALG